MTRVAVVGVGLLGSAVAGRLLDAGFEVTGWDIRPEALEPLTPRGLRAAGSLARAAEAGEALITVLPTPESVAETLGGEGALLARAPRGTTVLQMSTITPAQTRALAAAAAARGVGFLDTPMSGTSAMVARGDGVILVGGDPALAEACQPVLGAIARRTIPVGEAGQASLAKLAANLLVGVTTAAVAEALVLGAKGGLPPARLLAVLRETAAASRMLEIRGPLMAERRFAPEMKAELFLKDFSLMLEEGRRLGVALPLTGLARELTTATVAAGRGGQDLAAIVTTLERLAGLEG